MLSSDLVWSQDKSSSINDQWDEISVTAQPTGDVITVFCVIEQRYTNTTRVNAIDNVKLEAVQSSPGILGELKQNRLLWDQVVIDSAVITCVHFPMMMGEPVRIYIEDLNRSCGIGVMSTDWNLWYNAPLIGESISVQGTLTMVSLSGYPATIGEVVIRNAVVTRLTKPVFLIQPLALMHRHLGGGTFGIQPGTTGSSGLSNIGLLVKTVGKVTSGDSSSGWITDLNFNTCIYIDDGSKMDSGTGISGIKVIARQAVPSISPLVVGDMVMVTGISTVEEVNGSLKPIIILQTNNSISLIDQGY